VHAGLDEAPNRGGGSERADRQNDDRVFHLPGLPLNPRCATPSARLAQLGVARRRSRTQAPALGWRRCCPLRWATGMPTNTATPSVLRNPAASFSRSLMSLAALLRARSSSSNPATSHRPCHCPFRGSLCRGVKRGRAATLSRRSHRQAGGGAKRLGGLRHVRYKIGRNTGVLHV